ncbi:MAG: transcriptional regulator NrdR [Oscillospiraceae bacterium]|jgi:transcriptional repressor NrdR|nr:transcriptional regulator NrdR [Oscillospiraceae bacterium]
MKCPGCGYNDSKVIDSRPAENRIRRRRECLKCAERFTTYEIIEDMPVMVVKKDKTIEPFDSEKLMKGLLRATIKRPVKLKAVENIVEDIQADFKNNLQREVDSEKIGEIVLRKLKDIDRVAYVRFASVYREFDDVESFIKVISELSSEIEETP